MYELTCALSAGAFLSFASGQLLNQFATSPQQDAQLLLSKTLDSHLRLAVQYRSGKKQILQQARDAAMHM